MNADALTAERIGLAWLREAVAPLGAFGRRHDDATVPYGPGDEERASAEIADVVALAQRLDRDAVSRVRAALRAVPEPGPIVARARAGDPLHDIDFYELARFADAVDALRRAWVAAGGDPSRPPAAVYGVRAVLAPGLDSGTFYLADAFDARLAAARAALVEAERGVSRQRDEIAARVRDALGVDVAGDEFLVLRAAYDGDPPSGVRVVRDTPTYRVFAIVVSAPERDAAFSALAGAEEDARRALAAAVAREAAAVERTTRELGAFDRLSARVAFAQRWGGCVPAFDSARVAFDDAVFAPLAEALAARGHRYTPLSLNVQGVAVLTGPNMGGKSAALATAGFICACAALGVPPPAASATLPLLETVAWLGGDGPAERERLLSSYAAEIVRAGEALAAASPRALVMVDEFARTTGPREGRALLVAFLEALRARGAFALCATHFDGVAEAAAVEHLRIAGLRGDALRAASGGGIDAALETINVAMDYRVVAASDAGSESDALALASLLGLDADVVARARRLYEAPP